MKNWRWLVILLPILVGSALAVYFLELDPIHNATLYLQTNLGTFSILMGGLISLMIGIFFILKDRERKIFQHANNTAADEHRRFLRRLDHELKNPLTAIRAGLVNLAESPSKGNQAEILLSLETQALRLSRLSTDLRKLAEIEVRQLERMPVDLPAILNEAFQMAMEESGATELTLNLILPKVPWPLPTILGDADLLLVAIHNLMENAIKFSNPGDTVELRAFEDGQRIVIEVADTGPGIPENEQALVWDELYRGESSRGVPGSGLGLALVRIIIDRHSGKSTLRSRVDQGTVVTLQLPTS